MLVTGTEVEVLEVLGALVVVVVVVVEGEEADLEEEEELLVHAALDSSPSGLGIAGACSSAAPANTLITEENAAFSLTPCPCESHAESRDEPLSAGRHSAPTSVQVLAPVNVPDSANTFPSAPVRTSSSVSVHNAVLASENTFTSPPSICGLSAVPRAAERLEGSLVDSRRPGSA